MRRLLILILSLFCTLSSAQNFGQHSLKFIYVYHGSDTPVAELCKTLNNAFRDARNYGFPTIIYLANINKPFIATAGIGEADVAGFENIISRLQEKRFHEIDPQSDVEKIMALFNKYDFLSDDGTPKYSSMNWTFYVNQSFWDANYNELIIARLYYALDLGSLPSDFLRFQIYYSGTEDFKYNRDYPFGRKDLCPELKTIELVKF